ncbi:LysE family translocator [Herbiconiux sp. KACC 21604]|uniref:LysE family translocator n=1 Tax=unclassified Herbiconiux TaxID=2618217 RepID=UPI001492FC1A|nr:LysE family translocator [Herbiconiux sp. SALV-R1]QJU53957.1 LysE family translocator [Herbiconiux sp. SALV-R1]WPO84985.1 LysE family translocator [Herbiconiux sp. KACC 21604]
MVPAGLAGAFALAALALILLPGPSVLFVVGRSLALGRLGGLLSVLGNALGMLPAITLVALGVGTLVAQSVVVFTIMKIAGAAYLVYLGVQAIRHRNDHTASETDAPRRRPSPLRLVGEGFVVGATNPKTIVFFVAVLPQFVDYAAGSIPLQLTELGLIFFVISLVCDSVWALAAGSARTWLSRHPRSLPRLSAAGGAMMIGLGGALAFTSSKA